METSTGEAVGADGIKGSRVTCKCCPCGVPASRTATKDDAVGGWGRGVGGVGGAGGSRSTQLAFCC